PRWALWSGITLWSNFALRALNPGVTGGPRWSYITLGSGGPYRSYRPCWALWPGFPLASLWSAIALRALNAGVTGFPFGAGGTGLTLGSGGSYGPHWSCGPYFTLRSLWAGKSGFSLLAPSTR